ncbi:LysR family transcriptional regulator [Roseovarius sp. EL26]|uniref:LysR family transcriptional regulator n=1 Tax=Roseovarius sp. EL26 TaxID=2126672 RepID=UPI000EA39EFD|nr:LysR family transcriptional regulator [Roseovarius sp. EL26]
MKKTRLSLKWLEIFLLITRHGSLQAASEEAGLSISTVSHHLRSLEDELGVQLFDHKRRPIRLTSEGSIFQRNISEAMRLIHKAETEATTENVSQTRNLKLALIEDFDSEITPELARSLIDSMPNCRFQHLTRPSHDILELLKNNDIDIGVATRPQFPQPDLNEIPLLRDPFVMILPATNDTPPERLLDDPSTLPLLRYNQNQIIGTQIETQLRRLRISQPVQFEFDSNQTLMNMVAEGHGWAITTPTNFMRARRFHRQIKLVPFPGKEFARFISVFTTDLCAPQILTAINQTLRNLIQSHSISPMTQKFPWLRDQFNLMPDDTDLTKS